MSNIYIQEPPTSGKVLLKTSIGDIDVELWSREAPKACRNFIQLCLEGYYDNTIFHRVIKNFIAQGGDPDGTGMGGESIYGEPFKNEIHSRLRFVRRGLVALANTGNDDNGSQFFFTLGSTPELQNKHTIFGKVAGETIYNMIKFDELDVGSDDRPLYPPKIIKIDVLCNPFSDIVPRIHEKKIGSKRSEKKVEGVKNFNLLSFGSEAEEDENDLVEMSSTKKSKSMHDLADDPKLSSETELPAENVSSNNNKDVKIDACTDQQSSDTKTDDPLKSKECDMPIEKVKSEDIKNASNSAKNKVVIDDLLKERRKYESLKKKVFPQGVSRESYTLQMLNKFKRKIDSLNYLNISPEAVTNFNEDKWMAHTFKCEAKEMKLAKDANTKCDDWFEITDPRNEINKRKREDSSQVLKKLKN